MNPIVLLILFILGTSILIYSSNLLSLFTLQRAIKRTFSPYILYLVPLYLTAFSECVLIMAKFIDVLIVRLLYVFVNMYFGWLVYMVLFAAVFLLIDCFTKMPIAVGLLVYLLPPAAITIYGLINAKILHETEVNITLLTMKGKMTIAHLSDLHLGAMLREDFVEKIVKKLLEKKPDAIVITGDLFDGASKISNELVTPFLKLPTKVYLVTGNHDEMVAGEGEVSSAIDLTNIELLKNEFRDLGPVNLVGVNYSTAKDYLKNTIMNLNLQQSKPNILLYHVPDTSTDDLSRMRIAVHLAGHTHGGQFFPFHLHSYLIYKYFRGLYANAMNTSFVNVSQGCGTAGPPMRLFSQSEVCYVNLKGSEQFLRSL